MEVFFPEFIRKRIGYDMEIETLLESSLSQRSISKGELLFTQGSIAKEVFLIKKGLVRTYYLTKEGKEVTFGFSMEGQIVFAVDSFFELKKTKYSARAIEDCQVYSIDYGSLEKLMASNDRITQLAFNSLFSISRDLADDFSDIRCQRAKERYQSIVLTKPGIMDRASVVHIASYLGIAPETLSRIRKELE